jgi:hypothetical protein
VRATRPSSWRLSILISLFGKSTDCILKALVFMACTSLCMALTCGAWLSRADSQSSYIYQNCLINPWSCSFVVNLLLIFVQTHL